MTRVLCTSGVPGAAVLAAAVDAGLVGAGRRVLVVANEADVPEVTPDPSAWPGFAALATRFDEVVSWNALIAPLHPSAWRPPQRELPVLGRLLATRLGGGAPIDELIVESVNAGPGRALAALLPDPPITVLSAGPGGYAPPTAEPSTEVQERVGRLLFLELVPGAQPPQPYPYPCVRIRVPVGAARAVLPRTETTEVDAVVLGDRWAELGLLDADTEDRWRAATIRALVAAGHTGIVFAPHPAAGPVDPAPLQAAAAGARLTVGPPGRPHEAWVGSGALLVGTASPALWLDDRAVTCGTRELLDGLGRFDHPLRMPLVVADATLPRLGGGVAAVGPAGLIDAVAYCVAPAAAPQLRSAAVEHVARHGAAPYLHRGRLAELGVPVPSAASPPAPTPAPTTDLPRPGPLARARARMGTRSGR